MATLRMPISIDVLVPEDGCFIDQVKNQLSLASAAGNERCVVLPDPGGSGDHGVHGRFTVPKNYVGSEKLIIRGIIDGAPTTTTLGFGYQSKPLADDEAYDAALGTARLASESSISQADEDVYEFEIDISSDTYAVDDDVDFYFFVDDSAHTYTGNILLTGLFFEYADA